MNTNDTPDDGWADLAKELGLESGESSRQAEPVAEELEPESPEEFEEAPFGIESEDSADSEDGDEESDGDEEGESTGEPGEGSPKKRRRRRRRRKKKGPGEAGAEGAPVATVESDGEGEGEEEVLAESEDGWDDGSESEEVGAVVGEEQVTPEAAREIVANWNVPSWEEIVAGLYRPDR